MASDFTKPLFPNHYGPLFLRVSLGAYFLMAGLSKLDWIPKFTDQVIKFNILPTQIAQLYAMLLPYTEIMVGTLLIIGMLTRLTCYIGGALLFSFIYAFGVFPAGEVMFFNKDIILLAVILSILSTGAGAFSVDSARK